MLRTPAENVSERTVESFTRSHPSSSPSPSPSPSTPSPCPPSVSPGDRGSSCSPCDLPGPEQSDSDSGVSDLSSEISSGLKYKTKKVSPAKSKQRSEEGRKYKLSQTTKHRPEHRPEHRLVTRDHLEVNYNKEDSFLHWIKWSILIFLIFFLMLTLLIVHHVKCFNNICAISLDAKIQYYKYSSPI